MEELLRCAICLKEVVDPRFLPCHHSFCLGCLEDLQTHGGNTRCPYCNEPVHVTTPSQLPPDVRANSLSTLRAGTFTETYEAALQRTVDKLLVCTMCSEQLRDPRILPCHHSFCALCVQGRHEGGSLTCPTCGTQVHTTAALLPADFWLNSLSTLRRTREKVDNKLTFNRPKIIWVLLLIGMASLAGVLTWTRMPSSTKTVSMAGPKQFEQSTNLGTNTEGNAVLSSILQTCLYHMVSSKPDVDKGTFIKLMKATFHQESFPGRFLETTPGLASLTLTYIHKMTQSRLKAENQKTLGSISRSCLEHWRESAPEVETTRVLAAASEMCITDIMNQPVDDGVVLALAEVSQTCLYHWTKPETSLDSVSALESVTQTCLHHWIRLTGAVEYWTRLPSITQICMALLERSLPSADDAVALYAMSEVCLGSIIRAEPHTGHQVLTSVSDTCIGYLGQPGKAYTWKRALVSILHTCVQYPGGKNKRIKLGNTIHTCMSHLTKYPSDRLKTVASISALGVNYLHRVPQDAEVEAALYSIVEVCLDYWTNYGSASPSLPNVLVPLHQTPPTTFGEHVEAMETPSEASGVLLFAGLLILVLKLNLDNSVTEKPSTTYYCAGVTGALVGGEVILKAVTSKSLLDAAGVAVIKCTIPISCSAMILILVYVVFMKITIKRERRSIVMKENPGFSDTIKTLFSILFLCLVCSIFETILNQFIIFLLASYVFIICACSLWYLPKVVTIFAVLLGGGIAVGAVNLSIRFNIPLKLTCNVLITVMGTIAILS